MEWHTGLLIFFSFFLSPSHTSFRMPRHMCRVVHEMGFFFLSIAVPAHGRHARTGPSVAVALAVLSLSLFLSLSQLTDWLQIVIIECVYAYEWANLDHFSVWNGESLRRRSRCINQSSSPLCACQGGDGVWVKYLIHFGISLLRDDRSTTFTVRWISIVGPTEKN